MPHSEGDGVIVGGSVLNRILTFASRGKCPPPILKDWLLALEFSILKRQAVVILPVLASKSV